MKLAVTDHAVSRYRERVQGAAELEDESIREVVRSKITQALADGSVRPHPTEKDRRIVPFKAGESHLFFSIGPNKTSHPGELAVIGVLYDRELGGQGQMTIPLIEKAPLLKDVRIEPPRPAKYVVLFYYGRSDHEFILVKDDQELNQVLSTRRPDPNGVFIYEHQDVEIQTKYVVQKKVP